MILMPASITSDGAFSGKSTGRVFQVDSSKNLNNPYLRWRIPELVHSVWQAGRRQDLIGSKVLGGPLTLTTSSGKLASSATCIPKL